MGQDEQSRSFEAHSTVRRAAWRGLARAACALALMWCALGARSAAAADPNFEAWLSVQCGGLTLSSASGVPGGATHVYRFEGACNLREFDYDHVFGRPLVIADAKWDAASGTFTESVHLLAPTTATYISNGASAVTVKVGTGAELDTFKCDTDPVLSKSAHCLVASWHNGTGWGGPLDGFAKDPASAQRPILLGFATPAQAAQLSHGNALLPSSCPSVGLTYAAGVPNGATHSYKFSGTCLLYQTEFGDQGRKVTRVTADGGWNPATYQATQNVRVLIAASAGGGSWSAKYTCSDDPWLNPKAQCSRTSLGGPHPSVYDPITDVLAKGPIGAPADVAKAKQLSVLSAPKHLVARIGLGGRGGKSVLGHTKKAKLTIDYANPTVTHNCVPNGIGLVKVAVEIRDEGGALLPNTRLAFVRVSEQGGAGLHSAQLQLPEILPGRAWHGTLQLGTDSAHFSMLPGPHTLFVRTGPQAMFGSWAYVPAAPRSFTVTLPAGYCQPAGGSTTPNGPSNVMIHAGASPASATGTRAGAPTIHAAAPITHIGILHR